MEVEPTGCFSCLTIGIKWDGLKIDLTADGIPPMKNCAFLDRKLISALNETVDGHSTKVLEPLQNWI
jgi:hypothetical protein